MYKDEEKKFDVRVVEKHIQEGTITRAQLSTFLKKLPDVSSNIDKEYFFEFFPAPKKAKVGPPPSQPEEASTIQANERGA